ncbi:MAG: polysaccharide export protein [Geminicoccaceae bacterium]|nr:polysaccharide export protein [Geminicoccaceae bacterium]
MVALARPMRAWLTLWALLLLAACGGSSPPPAIVGAAPAASAAGAPAVVTTPPYTLASGDKVKVTVFRHEDLSGEFTLDGAGNFAMPLIGEVKAYGLTTRELEQRIAAMLKDGYLVDPQVSVEVTNYRPFYILGEVNRPGQYEYVNGMTALQAVTIAGGYTYRAKQDVMILKRGGANAQGVPVPPTQPILPGDIVEVQERFF